MLNLSIEGVENYQFSNRLKNVIQSITEAKNKKCYWKWGLLLMELYFNCRHSYLKSTTCSNVASAFGELAQVVRNVVDGPSLFENPISDLPVVMDVILALYEYYSGGWNGESEALKSYNIDKSVIDRLEPGILEIMEKYDFSI